VRRVADEPQLAEALLVSSRSLWQALNNGPERLPDKKLRRAVLALTRYRLRMATRATPFGLLAGVASIRFSDRPKTRLEGRHGKRVRPDMGWLAGLVAGWERNPQILSRLHVLANHLCVVRGGRLTLSSVSDGAGDDDSRWGASDHGEMPREVSMRYTPPVREALTMAARPIIFSDLHKHLEGRFPTGDSRTIEKMLCQLVEYEVLLTDLWPPFETGDPLSHVLERLSDVPDLPELEELRQIQSCLEDYASLPIGRGQATLTDVTERMNRLSPNNGPVQVDVRLNAEVTLPRAVAQEIEAVATVLWRVASPRGGAESLRAYHGEFVERYGTDRAVAVKELLNPEVGMGAPGGYRNPPSHRPEPAPSSDPDRTMLLATLAAEAVAGSEIEIDNELQRQLGDTESKRTLPESVDIYAQVLSPSVVALNAGDFRIALRPWSGRVAGGSTFGRFAYLFEENGDELAAMARVRHGSANGVVRAQLTWRLQHSRWANVVQVPMWLDHRLEVGTFTNRSDPSSIGLDDLAVYADHERLRVGSRQMGREMLFFPGHMLNLSAAPNAVRLLAEITAQRTRTWPGWDWGGAEALPYLPTVRYSRTVVSPARWRLTGSSLGDRAAPFVEWREQFERWRERWRVPDRVSVGRGDRHLDLNLGAPLHIELLRDHLTRQSFVFLFEAPTEEDFGWLAGPEGAHANEIVFSLTTPTPESHTMEVLPNSPSVRTTDAQHFPGGEWIYAKLYCSAESQTDVLAQRLGPLVDHLPEGIDRWFFVRYSDPDPHLRLRFHGEPAILNSQLLPAIGRWAAKLREIGCARTLVLDTYDPELERYGGPEAISRAEELFHADSLLVLEQLRMLQRVADPPETVLLAAFSCVDLARHFIRGAYPATDWMTALLKAYPKSEHHQAFQQRRRDALATIDPYSEVTSPATGPMVTVREALVRRAHAASRYGRCMQGLDGATEAGPAINRVLTSILHMHHNRLIGSDDSSEQDVYAILRGALQSHRDRRQFQR
jgi:thiopeptide-type bacteriocin biosynthesis protein